MEIEVVSETGLAVGAADVVAVAVAAPAEPAGAAAGVADVAAVAMAVAVVDGELGP